MSGLRPGDEGSCQLIPVVVRTGGNWSFVSSCHLPRNLGFSVLSGDHPVVIVLWFAAAIAFTLDGAPVKKSAFVSVRKRKIVQICSQCVGIC